MSVIRSENSGGSCDYYIVDVECPQHLKPYKAECGDIVDALQLTPNEANIFKEIWRTANARKGKRKKGNTTLRAAEKIQFYANRIYQLVKFEVDKND